MFQKMWNQYLVLLRAVLATLMFILVGVTSSNVLRRYGGFGTFPWADETSRRLLIWMTFCGAALAVASHSHLRIDSLLERSSIARRKFLEGAIGILTCGFALFLIWGGTRYSISNAGQRTPGMGISFAWTHSAVPVGGLLILISLLGRLMSGQKVQQCSLPMAATGNIQSDDMRDRV